MRLISTARAPVAFAVARQPAVGKTMIARNIAHAAVLAGHSVVYTTASALVATWRRAKVPALWNVAYPGMRKPTS